jgi:hypothetical protein
MQDVSSGVPASCEVCLFSSSLYPEMERPILTAQQLTVEGAAVQPKGNTLQHQMLVSPLPFTLRSYSAFHIMRAQYGIFLDCSYGISLYLPLLFGSTANS